MSDRGLTFVLVLLYSNESLNLDLVNTRSRTAGIYRQTRVAVNLSTVLYPTSHQYIACIHSYCLCSRIPELFWVGLKSILFSLFKNKKA